MRCLLIPCLFWGLLIVLQWGGYECCLKEERVGLLQIKEFFINASNHKRAASLQSKDLVIINATSGGDQILPSWLEKGDTNCCNWEGVTCNPTMSRVTELTLNDVIFSPKSCLNVSLFRPFHELVNLQLSGNHFNCCVHNHGKLIYPYAS